LLNSEDVRYQKPVVYQNNEGARKPVESQYVMTADNTIRFTVGDYDRSKPLVIDPVLVYSTYLGGSEVDFGKGIAVDASGNAYIVGDTRSSDFPAANAIQPTFTGFHHTVFVTKINASGSALVYSTYLGGSLPNSEGFISDSPGGIAVDASGNAYVAGSTASPDFPTTVGALQPTSPICPGSTCEIFDAVAAFVSKINASGSAFVYSTYLGGGGVDNFDVGTGIAADASGNAYVTGWTRSSSFPTANALQPTLKGLIQNAFVTKINANGSAFVYSTYLGGTNLSDDTPKDPGDQGNGIAADSSGNAYVAGQTSSADFPTANPLQSTLAGPTDAFLTKINASGTALVYSTFFGGSGDDRGDSVAVDAVGNAYIAGTTFSTNFPAVSAVQSTFGGGSSDSFVAEINPSGSALGYSTYLGGSGDEFSGGIALDSLGNVYITGFTRSPNFPTANPLQHALSGTDPSAGDAFVSKIASTIAGRLNVVIDGCDSGVTNAVLPSGRTISDLIAECAKDASNHGQFVSCVAHVTNDLSETRTISGQQQGAIQSCAAQAHIP
jgi:Beta-propeller repeat